MFQQIENELLHVFENYRNVPNVEIEARLGWKKDRYFSANINKDYYKLISQQLESSNVWDKTIHNVVAEINYGDIRKSKPLNSKPFIIKKTTIYKKDITICDSPYDLRISVSTEVPICNNIELKPDAITCERSKIRKSFIYKMWSYDLTQVKFDEKYMYDDEEDDIQFQFEIEFLPDTNEPTPYLAKSLTAKILDLTNVPEIKST
jgi:hypothetical protein